MNRRMCRACRSRGGPARRNAGKRRVSRSDGDRADCQDLEADVPRQFDRADPSLAPARCRKRCNGSPGSGSPSIAGATPPSRAAGRLIVRSPSPSFSSRSPAARFASATDRPSRKRGIEQRPVVDIGGVADREGRRILARRQHDRESPAADIFGQIRGRADHAPGSRKSRPCRIPSARNWRHRPGTCRLSSNGCTAFEPVE